MRRLDYYRQVQEILALIRNVQPFEDTSPGAKFQRKKRAERDWKYFARTYFPHYFTTDFAPFHEEIWQLIGKHDTVAIAVPRHHGKSTIGTLLKTAHAILFKKAHFIVIGSATEDSATWFTMRLKLEIENNPRIRSDFGNLKGGIWGDSEFMTKTGIGVMARGRGQAIRGAVLGPFRPDLVILDDIEDDVQARNRKRSRQVLEWILGTVYPSLADGGKLVVIGTILSKKSALQMLLQQEGWVGIRYKAIENGKPLWPQKFSLKRLEEMRRKMGRALFMKEMMNSPEDESDLFQEKWLRWFDEDDIIGLDLRRYSALDPSVKASNTNDYKALITIGVRFEPFEIYVLNAWIRHATIDQMVDAAYRIYEEWRPLIVGIETVSWQEILLRDFDRAVERYGYALPLKGIKHSVPKEARIQRLSPLLERGILKFRKKANDDTGLLIEQLLDFPDGEHDDGPDALEMAVSLAEYANRRMEYRSVRRRESARWLNQF